MLRPVGLKDVLAPQYADFPLAPPQRGHVGDLDHHRAEKLGAGRANLEDAGGQLCKKGENNCGLLGELINHNLIRLMHTIHGGCCGVSKM